MTDLEWDESTRPEYTPAGAPEPYSTFERARSQELVQIHDHLRRELDQLLDLIDQVRGGTLDVGRARSLINTLTLRQNNWTLGAYCASYCRLVTTHHSIEDQALFPRMRSVEPGLGPVIDRLEAEHHVIAGAIEEVDRALVRLVSEPEGIEDVARGATYLSDTLRSHLRYEERSLLDTLARHGMW